MVKKIIQWSLDNPLVVVLLALGLAGIGTYSFLRVNVEAYPDPAPAIIEVIAQYPGASAEEVERQVTTPLEMTLTGMPGLNYTSSKSLFGLAHLRCQFKYDVDYKDARQEVINRIQFSDPLPSGVSPQLSPESPTGEIYRYTLRSPKDGYGHDLYSLNDLKAVQDWTLERIFRRVDRIIDVASSGGTVKRYEIHPDPARMIRYGITLQQLQTAIANSNTNVGGDYLATGDNQQNVRGVGLIRGGLDPLQAPEVLGAESHEMERLLEADRTLSPEQRRRLRAAYLTGQARPPLNDEETQRLAQLRKDAGDRAAVDAVKFLRQEDRRRIQYLRQITVTAVGGMPRRVEDLVEGGPVRNPDDLGKKGVVVGHQTRLGKTGLSGWTNDASGHAVPRDEPEKVQGIVLMRKGEHTLPALEDVKAKVKELNETPGRLPPGVKVDPYYDRTDLINVTTETVRENLAVGIGLVIVILFMFLNNVRTALIVALNIPMALLFAFSVLFLRGKSANLLSIGAVDFGIIVDSSVIMVENIYRHLSAGEYAELPLKERILMASGEITRALFFSTAIMVCAFIPLFTMRGPEGQLFGPMADTYAFALGGALLLALTLTPVLCLIFLRNLQPARDNWVVRMLKSRYLKQLATCLKYRWTTLALMSSLVVGTAAYVVISDEAVQNGADIPHLGREFMPELEEGNLWIRATFPVNITLEASSRKTDVARQIMLHYPEVEIVVAQVGRPDDGTDPTGFYNVEFFVPLKPQKQWPKSQDNTGWRRLFGGKRSRTKVELIEEMSAELRHEIPGVNWNFSQNIRDNVMESLSGVKGDNSVKIFGPDLDELEKLAEEVKKKLDGIPGIKDVGIFRVKGQPNLELAVDPEKCKRWGASTADVQAVLQTAVGGKAFSQMIEGEKRFDISLRWPEKLRNSEAAIRKIPVDIGNNQVPSSYVSSTPSTRQTGSSLSLTLLGTSMPLPALLGNVINGALNYLAGSPRRPLDDFLTPQDASGNSVPKGSFVRPGASTIYREQGERFIAVKFSVRNRDLASAVAEAQEKTADLFQPPYRVVWSGEFEEMQAAEGRLLLIVPLSLSLIFGLLYMAFGSFLDSFVVFSNVLALCLGGVWALLLTGTNFSISAAVGFVSLFGVAIMDGLLMISYFNQLRAHGLPLNEAIMQGAEKRVRPVMMTALTAILGLLPAALSTRIGAQTQRPLAIVVVGGMVTTLFLTRYLMPVLYSFYGHREPPAGSGDMAH